MSKSRVRLRHRNELYVDLPVPAAPAAHRFHVLFHGLISLVEGPSDEFRAYALTMDDDHCYRFGHWLVEEELPSGMRATLRGVQPSPKSAENTLNPERNPTLRVKGWPSDDDPRVRARLALPRPRQIHYLGLGTAEVTRPDLLLHPKPTACGLTVFEYDLPDCVEDLEILSVDGKHSFWKANACTEFAAGGKHPAARLVTLHVFDAPSRNPRSRAHSVDEFALSASLLGQPAVGFARKPVDLTEQPPPPQGISPYEVMPLVQRSRFLHRIADFARTARFSTSQPLSDDECKSCCSAADGQWP